MPKKIPNIKQEKALSQKQIEALPAEASPTKTPSIKAPLVKPFPVSGGIKNLFLKVSLQEKILLTRNLAIMVRAGMPLLDSINLLQGQTKSKSLAKILSGVAADVSNGQFLSKSLDKYHNVFGDLFTNIIRIGETSGTLPENLNYLSDELKKKSELRKKVIGALIYPIVIVTATFGITLMMAIFIFPKITPVFASLHVDLPMSTKILIAVSDLLTKNGLSALGALAGLIIAFWGLLKIYKIKFYSHLALIYLPLVGQMSRDVNIANFTRTLGMLLKSGIKIVEAINITSDTLSNLVYREELKKLAAHTQKGESISKYLSNHPRLFPPMLVNMISVGENTGNLSETLLYLADFYAARVDDITKNLSTALEPILMVVMGLTVGFVAISVISPIYQVTQTMGR